MTSSPPIVIRPAVGSMSRLIIFIVVVLPHPDGPTRTTVSPLPISRERSPTAGARAPGKRLDTFRREIMVSATRLPGAQYPTRPPPTQGRAGRFRYDWPPMLLD